MKCDKGEPNRAVCKGSRRQRSLERAQSPSQVSLTQRDHPETEMGVTATERVIGIFRDAKCVFGNVERFGKFAGLGKAPRDKTARERGGQDEHPETFADQIALQIGGIPAKILARLD